MPYMSTPLHCRWFSQLLKAIFSHSQFVVNGLILEKDQKNFRKSGKSMTGNLSIFPENDSIYVCYIKADLSEIGPLLLIRFTSGEHEVVYRPVDGDIGEEVQQAMGIPLILFGRELQQSARFE